MTQARLRVGILLDSAYVPAWQFAMMERIAGYDYASVSVLTRSHPASGVRGEEDGPAGLFGGFRRYEEKRQQIGPDACARMSVANLPGNIERLSLPVGHAAGPPQDHGVAAAADQPFSFDVVIALDGLAMIDELCPASRSGVWFYGHGSGQTGRTDGASVAFWEVIRREPCVWSALLVRRADLPGDRIACDSYSGVHYLSHGRSRNEHLWKIVSFVPRMLQRLHDHGHEKFLASLQDAPAQESLHAHRRSLSDARLVVPLLVYAAWRLMQKIVRRLYTERWILMFGMTGARLVPGSLKKLLPPDGRFWADPFAIQRDGSYHVFFEDADLETGHGRLSAVTMTDSDRFGPAVTVLERPYHLSYPFIFEWENSLYLIPESADNRTVELYRCVQFPHEWVYQHTLMEGLRAYDSTLLEHDGTWWLFAAVQEHDGASSWDELCLFYADYPLSTSWHPHPMNPVVSDVRSARPAGPFYRENGRICRPSQNSSYLYGYALNVNEVLELTRTRYRERLIETFEPGWDSSVRGMHTYSRAGDLTLVDAYHRARRHRTWTHG